MKRYIFHGMPALLLAVILLPGLAADSATAALDLLAKTHAAGAQSQARIDKLDDDMRRMRDEMRRGVLELESLKTELPELQRFAATQSGQRAQLEREFSAGVPGQLNTLPALSQMVDWLDRFVRSDLPFMHEQRMQRIAGLKSLLANETVSAQDKLRAVLEVTQVELQYGRSVSTYSGSLKFAGEDTPMDFLRVGRLMLYYQDQTGQRQGYWDRASKRWQVLPVEAREQIDAGITMARGETAPELMELLLPVPESGS